MNDNPHEEAKAKKWKKRRIRIALVLLIAPVVTLPVVHLVAKLTSNVQIHYGELLTHFFITVLGVMGVHILVEDWLSKSQDSRDSQLSLEAKRAEDDAHLTEILKGLISNEWERTEPLVAARKEQGLETIYSSRKEIGNEILQNLREANKRIWLLGITFSRQVVLEEDLLDIIRKKLGGQVDVKILLANAVRSLAVFRTLLESSDEDVKRMIRDRDGYKKYFEHRFYLKFLSRVREFNNISPHFQNAVRFYGHSPSCWMVIVDDKCLYYQPYVLGRIEDPDTRGDKNKEQEARTIGNLMPVFKFVDPTKKPFQSLADHFEILWSTSDTDLFLIGARIENKELRLQKIFEERGAWFEYVVSALRVNKDRRAYPRKPYRKGKSLNQVAGGDGEQPTEEWLYWIFNFSESPLKDLSPIKVKMENVSFSGCAIRITPTPEIRELFKSFSNYTSSPQFSNQQQNQKDVEITSYQAKYVAALQKGFVTLTPPDVSDLKELEYLVNTMRDLCGFRFTIQNWTWDANDMERDLLIGVQCKLPPRNVSHS
jgi:hypothetical protein